MTHPEGLRARDVLNELANRLTLTPFEQTEYETGGRRFEKLVRFATIPAVKAGWLVKDRGTWIITEEGSAVSVTEGLSPACTVPSQLPISMMRSWPILAAAPSLPVLIFKEPLLGPI